MKTLVVVLALFTVSALGVVQAGHAQCFRYYFSSIGQADRSLNPVERALFSLMLAQSAHPEKKMGRDGRAIPPHKHA